MLRPDPYKYITISKIHKGDLVSYDGHISIVYSERWGESNFQTTYDVIHAYGNDEYLHRGLSRKIFSRKVLITGDVLPKKGGGTLEPVGFGRIKLWK